METKFTVFLWLNLWLGLDNSVSARAADIQSSNIDSQPTVVERGPYWRTWATSKPSIDAATGATTSVPRQYTELSAGLHYWSETGWAESLPLIELTENGGAQAVHGQHKALLEELLATNEVSIAAHRQLPPTHFSLPSTGEIELTSQIYNPNGLCLDYTVLTGSASYFNFGASWTYVISNTFYVGPGTATFAADTCVKYATNASLLLSGPVSFPSSGAPATFTSVDDNAYGIRITGSSGTPNYTAIPAIRMYYEPNTTTIQNSRIRWAQRGIQEDESEGVHLTPTISGSTFMNCLIGVYVNAPSDTINLTSDFGCNLTTPVSINAGGNLGSISTDCGVVSVARVNDPYQDTAAGDPTGDPNKNAQSECSFVLVDTNNIVAAFFDTHLGEYNLGEKSTKFTGITSPRAIGWAVSTNGAASFVDKGAIPPSSNPNRTQGDTGDPVMVRDKGSGTIYLLGNPSREPGYYGFRLWNSTDNGQTFALINTNVPSGTNTATGFYLADKPALAINNFTGLPNSAHLYVAGTFTTNGGSRGVAFAHSSNNGVSWDSATMLSLDSHAADFAIGTNGAVYVFYQLVASGTGGQTNTIQYKWLTTNGTWHGPISIQSHTNSSFHYSMHDNGSGNLLRSNTTNITDYFISNGFPRVSVNPVNGSIYLVYADQSAPGTTNTDRGDIWIQEGVVTNSDGSLRWSGPIKVNNDRTATDQWDPSVTVNPAGTEVFIGYYSRESDPNNNSLIKAYGAKASISSSLINATFDTFPISNVAFTNLFWGVNAGAPNDTPWLFDAVWATRDLGMDTNARIVDISSGSNVFMPLGTVGGYEYFTADDYTWSASDNSHFYFAWRYCSDLCTNKWIWNGSTNNYIRADPNIRLGKIKQ